MQRDVDEDGDNGGLVEHSNIDVSGGIPPGRSVEKQSDLDVVEKNWDLFRRELLSREAVNSVEVSSKRDDESLDNFGKSGDESLDN